MYYLPSLPSSPADAPPSHIPRHMSYRSHVLAFRATFAALTLSSLLCAQTVTPSAFENAPQSVLDGFQTRAATLQPLVVPQQGVPAFDVSVSIGGKLVKLQLQAKDVRAKDYKLLVHDENGLHELPRSPNTTFRGRVEGYPDSLVSASLFGGQLSAEVSFGADQPIWNVQPLTDIDKLADKTTYVVHNARDSNAPPGRCGTEDHRAPTGARGRPRAPRPRDRLPTRRRDAGGSGWGPPRSSGRA